MAGMDPETGFVPEARKLFGSEEVVYIKVAKGGQPICRWVKEWAEIAKDKGLDARHRERILKGEGVLFPSHHGNTTLNSLSKHRRVFESG